MGSVPVFVWFAVLKAELRGSRNGAMSYLALYRKWRPLVFDDVIGQDHVTETLRNSVKASRISHAYLFCGTRGTGKTSVARILARAVNCLEPKGGNPCNKCSSCADILSGSTVDVIEIDAASNNSVDNVRDIRDEVVYTPSVSKFKVYIIDEVHMLSSGAFNALLKTLEEPPQHVIFMLATTEPHKLPATILSRCQRFDFRRISPEGITAKIESIAVADGIDLDHDAALLIAALADGAMRDALSLLDQCLGMSRGSGRTGNEEGVGIEDTTCGKSAVTNGKGRITLEAVRTAAGIADNIFTSDMVDAVMAADVAVMAGILGRLLMEGKEIQKFISDLITYYRNMLICRLSHNPGEIVNLPEVQLNKMKEQAKTLSPEWIIAAIKKLSQTEPALKWSNQPRILLEVALIEISGAYKGDAGVYNEGEGPGTNKTGNIDNDADNAANKALEGTLIKAADSAAGKAVPADHVRDAKKMSAEIKITAADTQDVVSRWAEILDHLKANRFMVAYSNLLDTCILRVNGNLYRIVFGKDRSINKLIMSKSENIDVLKKAIEKTTGVRVDLQCVMEGDEGRTGDGAKHNGTGAEVSGLPLGMPTEEAKKTEAAGFTAKALAIAEQLNIKAKVVG